MGTIIEIKRPLTKQSCEIILLVDVSVKKIISQSEKNITLLVTKTFFNPKKLILTPLKNNLDMPLPCVMEQNINNQRLAADLICKI